MNRILLMHGHFALSDWSRFPILSRLTTHGGNRVSSLLDNRFIFVLDQVMASVLDGESENSGNFPTDVGHGTLVACVLHLVAPEARIVPIKAFNAYGHTTMFAINTADPIGSLSPGYARMLGNGRINALQALRYTN